MRHVSYERVTSNTNEACRVWMGVGWLRLVGSFKLCLCCRISFLLQASFAKETYNFNEPTSRSHPIARPMTAWLERMRHVTRDWVPSNTIETHCSDTLQHCNTLQHTATQCVCVCAFVCLIYKQTHTQTPVEYDWDTLQRTAVQCNTFYTHFIRVCVCVCVCTVGSLHLTRKFIYTTAPYPNTHRRGGGRMVAQEAWCMSTSQPTHSCMGTNECRCTSIGASLVSLV